MKAPLRIITAFALSLFGTCALALDANEEAGPDTPAVNYLVYSVTWQPSFCAKERSVPGCDAAPQAFLTHGIWPYSNSTQEKTNRHPQNCTTSSACNGQACAIDEAAMQTVLGNKDIRSLVTKEPKGMFAHEWKKHGTCSGKSMEAYFNDIVVLRPVVKYDKAKFDAMIGQRTAFSQIKEAFPSNTSFRCFVIDGQQYLHEVFYLIDAQGNAYNQDKHLQIGIACENQQTLIPAGV